jgi:ADP-heptose:LPS heptosyltransferase
MNDPIQKRFELWFRRKMIHMLGYFFRRQNTIPDGIDFNRCKYLFIRQDRIGDVLISTPLFALLKKYYPNAIIDVLLSENNYFVLENDPFVHKRWKYTKKLKDVIGLVRSLQRERYDFIIDLMDNPSATSTALCLLAHAKWNVGIEKENSYIYDILVPMLSRRDTHIIERIAQLLIPFKIQPSVEQLSIRYFTSTASDEFADQFMKQQRLSLRPLIGVNISAGDDVRFWGVENYQKLLNHIENHYPEFGALLLYQPSDVKRAKTIIESNSTSVLSPITATFDQFAALVKRLIILVTPDTSAVHLTSAFKVGAVVLYVQSNKALRIWEPFGTDYEVLVTAVDELSRISVEDVQDALKKLIQRRFK